jgi:subtilisin family serine protease
VAQEGGLLACVRLLASEPADFPFQALPARLFEDDHRGSSDVFVDLIVTLPSDDPWERERVPGLLAEAGFRRGTTTRRAIAGSARLRDLGRLLEVDGDFVVEVAHPVHPQLNVTVPEAWNLQPGWSGVRGTGQGVVVGIVDSGVDVTHPCFRTAAGGTRLLAFWDQAPSAQPPGPPAGHAAGSEWGSAAIDALLAAGTVPVQLLGGDHGTEVAGVAAGNGLAAPQSGTYVGVAEEASLVVVDLNATRDSFPSSANVVDAIRYVFDLAGSLGRRAVVNLSQGARLGPHDPTGGFETLLDDLLEEDESRIVVVSAGNDGERETHARIDPQQFAGSVDLELVVPRSEGPWLTVELWSADADFLEVELIDPRGAASPPVSTGKRAGGLTRDGFSIAGVPNVNGVRANQTTILVTAGSGALLDGRWTIRIRPIVLSSGEPVHAWLDSAGSLARFEPRFADAESTMTSPATAEHVIAVGAYRVGPVLGAYEPSSSRGPDRRGNPLRLLTAPGAPVTTCTTLVSGAPYGTRRGTSLAAPHVTGAIALMLEQRPELTRDEVAGCLLGTARIDADTILGPASGWGAGKLDIAAALDCTVAARSPEQQGASYAT